MPSAPAISPVARKLAAELGVELARVAGTGPGGRRRAKTWSARLRPRAPRPGTRRAQRRRATVACRRQGGRRGRPRRPARRGGGQTALRSIPMRGMRKTIADRMSQSLRESAQLTITIEADVTPAASCAERLVRQFDFTYGDLLMPRPWRAPCCVIRG